MPLTMIQTPHYLPSLPMGS